MKRPPSLLPLQGFLYRALGITLATGLEADKVEVLLLELLYKTDYSDNFDREVRVPRGPPRASGGRGVCTPVPVGRRCVYVSVCMRVSTHVCAGGDRWGVPPPRPPSPFLLGLPAGCDPVLWPVCPGPGEDGAGRAP